MAADRDALLALADTWQKSGDRLQGRRSDVATALIGCAQALRAALGDEEPDA